MTARDLEQDLRGIAAAAHDELRHAINVLNDRVVPAVRRETLEARNEGARLLRKWADRLQSQHPGSHS